MPSTAPCLSTHSSATPSEAKEGRPQNQSTEHGQDQDQPEKDITGDDLTGGAEQGAEQRLSTSRIMLLTIVMTLTSFTGLAASLAVTLLVPSIARTLGSTNLEGQWVSIQLRDSGISHISQSARRSIH